MFSTIFKRTSAAAMLAAATATIAGSHSTEAAMIQNQITIEVIPTLAPNAFGSPNFAAWEANTTAALDNGFSTFGSGAAQFDALANNATMDWRQAVVTGFESWRGVADPNAASFSGEYGNRMHFALHILGNGNKFSISELSFDASSTDPGNALAFGYGAGEYNYGSGYVGIDYGLNGIKGGGDDVYITSGPNTQLVDELVARGSGNSLDAYLTDPGVTLQDRIDNSAAIFGIDSDFSFTGTYTLGLSSGSATVNYTVPEPATIGLTGIAGLGLIARRRQRRA